MSARHKGLFGEELIASIVVVVLLMVFILSVIHMNNQFLSEKSYLDAQRTASTLVEKMYFDSNGTTADPANFVKISLSYPAKIMLTDTERNLSWTSGGTGTAKSVTSASAAMMISNNNRMFPARLEVFVPV